MPAHTAAVCLGLLDGHRAHPRAFLDQAAERLDIRAVQVDGGAESVAGFEAAASPAAGRCWCCRRASRNSTASSNALTAPSASSAGTSTGASSAAPPQTKRWPPTSLRASAHRMAPRRGDISGLR